MAKIRWLTAVILALLLSGWLPQAAAQERSNPFSPWTRGQGQGQAPPPPTAAALPSSSQSGAAVTLEATFAQLALRQKELPVNLWFPGSPRLGETEIYQGAAIAQGIALRTGHLPILATAKSQIVPGSFNVVVGTVDQLPGLLSQAEIAAVRNGYLLLRQPQPGTWLLIITGRHPSGINSAILSLGMARSELPAIASASIQEVFLPESPPFLRREPLKSETTYTFTQLKESGVALRMISRGVLRMEFSLPGDFSNLRPGHLRLDFHVSGETPESPAPQRAQAIVNDEKEPIASLPNTSFTNSQHQITLELPLAAFQPGRNTIDVTFQQQGTLLQSLSQRSLNTAHSVFTDTLQIYSTSLLTLPDFTATPVLPNLAITSRTAYPLVGQPDGSEITVYLTEKRQDLIESAWNIMARLAQSSNTLLYAATYTFELPATSHHLVAIGTRSTLPEAWRTTIPRLIFEEPPTIKPREQEGTNLRKVIREWQSSMREAVAKTTPSATPTPTPPPAVSKKERAYLGCIPPVADEHGWLLLFTAQEAPILSERIRQLVLPEYWNQLISNHIYWDRTPESLTPYAEGPRVTLSGLIRYYDDTLVEMPLGETYELRHWLIAVIVVLFFSLVVTTRMLNRLYQRGGYRF